MHESQKTQILAHQCVTSLDAVSKSVLTPLLLLFESRSSRSTRLSFNSASMPRCDILWHSLHSEFWVDFSGRRNVKYIWYKIEEIAQVISGKIEGICPLEIWRAILLQSWFGDSIPFGWSRWTRTSLVVYLLLFAVDEGAIVGCNSPHAVAESYNGWIRAYDRRSTSPKPPPQDVKYLQVACMHQKYIISNQAPSWWSYAQRQRLLSSQDNLAPVFQFSALTII